MNYKEARAKAEEIDKGLRVGEHFKSVVYIEHLDHSKMELWFADIREDGEWVMIFTEHHGIFVYHKEDLENIHDVLIKDADMTTLMHNVELDLDKDVYEGLCKYALSEIKNDKAALIDYAANKAFKQIVGTDGEILKGLVDEDKED